MLNMNDGENNTLIKNKEKLCFTEERRILSEVLEQTFSKLDPVHILRNEMERLAGSINTDGNLYVIGFGKASLKMYEGIRPHILGKTAYSGLIIPVGENKPVDFPELDLLRGNHPIPGKDTLESSSKLLNAVSRHVPNDTFIILISGGGSALFEVPQDNLSISEIGTVAKCLMNSGADIRELNIVRHLMSKVKGGKLAELLFPSRIFSYVISDVPGDDLQLIASGPLTQPEYAENEVRRIIDRYSSECGELKEIYTHSTTDITNVNAFKNVNQNIILKNSDFVKTISAYLSSREYYVANLDTPVEGDVNEVASFLTEEARKAYKINGKSVWLVCGGETTAIVKGKGIGGRNCELSLRVSQKMAQNENFMFASIGTDGIDGVSPAMGGITDTWFKRRVPGSEIEQTLKESDSYTLLDKNNSAIETGYTGTNVSDVFVMYYSGTIMGD